MASSILVVDDDVTFQTLLTFALEKDGYLVTCVNSAQEMNAQLNRSSFNLILLDLGLPDEDGLVLLRQIRARAGPPVIVLTGRKEQDALISALELGADDYVTKPFDPREVLLRVKGLLARTGRARSPNSLTKLAPIKFSGWTFDPRARSLRSASNKEVALTASEFNLLRALLAQPGWAISRDQLLDAISDGADTPTPRMIDVFVSQLRSKIETDKKNPKLIISVRGYGYKFGGKLE